MTVGSSQDYDCRCVCCQVDLSRLLVLINSQISKLPLISMNNGQTLVCTCTLC